MTALKTGEAGGNRKARPSSKATVQIRRFVCSNHHGGEKKKKTTSVLCIGREVGVKTEEYFLPVDYSWKVFQLGHH